MPKLIVETRDGTAREIEAEAGISVMEAIRDAGFDELTAICGGCCSCATCHVHFDSDIVDRLPPMSEDESELLGLSADRTATSRLSCQVPFDESLDGIRVRIAQED